MRAALFALAFACCGLPASAETAEQKRKAIVEVFEASLREHAVFLNCSATDRDMHRIARKNWEEMIAATLLVMSERKADAALVAEIGDRAAYDKMMRLDATLRELLALCPENWQKPLIELRFIFLHNRVGEILGR